MKIKNQSITHIFAVAVIMLLMLLNYFSNENIFEHTWQQGFFFMMPTILLVLVNNAIYIPKFLNQNKNWLYGTVLFLSLVFAQIITGNFTQPHYFNLQTSVLLFDFSRYLVTTLAGFGFIAFIRLEEKQRQNYEQQLLIRQTELNLLKKQINPHFLFNILNNIYYQCLEGSTKAPEMIEKLSSLMRYTLDNTEKEQTPLEKEFQFIKNYVDLEKSRLPEKAKVSLKKKGNFSGVQIAPLILISFIENCFKHGNSIEPNIEIFIEFKGNELILFTENTIGKLPRNEKPSGTGVANVTKRLELLYPEKHSLNIEKSAEKFIVSLMIEL